MQKSEIRFRKLFETMAQGVTYQNSKGEIIEANEAALRILGLTFDQLQGKTSFDPGWKTIHEDGTDFPGETHASMVALKTGKEVNNVVMGVFNPVNQEYRWLKIDSVPEFRNGEKKPFQVFTTFNDISELKRTELLLKENETRYVKAQQLGKVGNWEFNLQTAHFWASEEAKRIFGFNPAIHSFTAEFVESCIVERERVHQSLVDLIEKGEKYDIEYVVFPKNGEVPRVVHSIAEIINDNAGNPAKIIGVIEDITERKKAKDELKLSRAHFRSLVENVQGFVLYRIHKNTTDNSLTVRLVSPSIKEMLGITDPKRLNDWFKNIHPDDRERITEAHLLSIQEGKSFDQIMRIIDHNKDNCRWIQAISYPVHDPADNSIYFNGIIIDITQRKLAQERLAQSEEKFRAMFENSLTSIMVADDEGNYIAVNKACETMFGFSQEELIAMNVKQLRTSVPNDAAIRYAKYISKGREKGEFEFFNKSNEYRVAFYDAVRVTDNFNLSVLMDITDLKCQTFALQRSEILLRETGKLSKIGGWDLDLRTMEPYFTDEVYRIYEIPFDSIPVMEDGISYYAPEARPIIQNAISEAIEKHKPYDLEVPFITAKGNKIWVRTIGQVDVKNGKAVRLFGALQDITERKEAALKLEEYQKSLRKLTIELSLIEEKQRKEIAENIHDHLSQSLVISKMKLSDLLRETKDKDKQNELEIIINHISEALENSRKITYDLSPPVLYDLGLIEAIYWLSDKIEDENQIKVQFETEFSKIDLSEPQLILIYRVVQEILNNAVKHSDAVQIDILFTKHESGLQISIKDNGKGFSESELEIKSKTNTGFGLFAVRERVENLQGNFELNSSPGAGTEALIFIPLKD